MSAKKEGLDYFPFSVDLLEDETLDILREDYGVVVNDVYISLLCLLYKKKGYYVPYETEKEKKDCVWFIYKRVRGGRYPVQQNAIPAVIESLVSQGLFSGRYFPKIITSERAQRTYYSATVERKADSLDIKPEYWLLSIEDMEKLSKKHPYYLSCTQISKSDDLKPKSDEMQPKSDEIPLKESKGNNILTYITSSSPPISPKGDVDIKTIPIKETAIAFRMFVEEFKIVVIPNTDLSVFTLETIQSLTDKFRRISWLGDEPHDSKWIAERAEQIINGIYDYSIDRDYTVYQEVDENGEVKDIVSYMPIEKPKKRKAREKTPTKKEQRKEQDEMIFEVLGSVWREGKKERGELNDDE